MATRKPKIEYYWSIIKYPKRLKKPTEIVVNWRLKGANGELMCSSNQGSQDKTDARRAVRSVMTAFGVEHMLPVDFVFKEVGPGKKPTPIGETK